ncbi:MAG: replicative DNA helicase, partial [Planctomycetes bacterium]|nr:replicative DNA helicase [Planctomycetota bacterium]
MSRLFESLPPHAIEAEMSLLGSMLIEPQVIGDIVFIVKNGDDFFKPANGAIFNAMIELYDKTASLDIVQLNQKLADKDVLSSVGGVEYLVQLANAVPSAANAEHYARLVREKGVIRQLIGAAGDILYDAYHSPDAAQDVLDQAEHRIFHIAQQADSGKIVSLHDLIQQTMDMIEANAGKTITGMPTGFSEIDELTGGLQKGEVIIVAGRPSMGKTAFALNVAEQIAFGTLPALGSHSEGERTPVGLFSLEMSKAAVSQRMLSAYCGIDSHRIQNDAMSADEFRMIVASASELAGSCLIVDDTSSMTILTLRARARRMVAQHHVKVILVDYLQLLTSPASGKESRQVEVSAISREIKALSRELSIPIVCLSQLNRGAESREGNRPRMSDLRESGAIEQDADVVLLLHP